MQPPPPGLAGDSYMCPLSSRACGLCAHQVGGPGDSIFKIHLMKSMLVELFKLWVFSAPAYAL